VTADTAPPPAVLEQYGLDPASVTPLAGGLINASFAVRRLAGDAGVLQRLNPIFAPAVNEDLDAVTRHLHARGLVTPLLLPTLDQRKYLEHAGALWRLLTRIEGETRETLSTDREASEAGRVLGVFHAALADFEAPLANRRPGVHDIARHLANLERALSLRLDHADFAQVHALAREILAFAREIAPLPALPSRLVHGDPKISNVVFAGDRAVCLVDLDTIARMPVPLELGDAIRSWCNTAAEDSADSQFSIERYRAAIAGYREGAGEWLSRAEWQAIPAAAVTIAVELAARFAADALEESYFGWDPSRFRRASEHNLARARAQLALARGMRDALPAMREALPA
jgi:Ser/Thr protein kinase RdoA (MazF antagonist)